MEHFKICQHVIHVTKHFGSGEPNLRNDVEQENMHCNCLDFVIVVVLNPLATNL